MDLCQQWLDCIEKQDWHSLAAFAKPADFVIKTIPSDLDNFLKTVKAAELVVDESDSKLPLKAKIIFLKCISNSCLDGYKDEKYNIKSSTNSNNFYQNLYEEASGWTSVNKENGIENGGSKENSIYPYTKYFPYEHIIIWVVKTISEFGELESKKSLVEEQVELLCVGLRFLCNFLAFAINLSYGNDKSAIPSYFNDEKFKNAVIEFVSNEKIPIVKVSCCFVNNMIKNFDKSFHDSMDMIKLTKKLMKSTISDVYVAWDTLSILLQKSYYLRDIYDKIEEDKDKDKDENKDKDEKKKEEYEGGKLHLLDIIYQEVSSNVHKVGDEKKFILHEDVVEYLSDKFKRNCDIILNTKDGKLKNIEPTEVSIILDILGILTSNPNGDEAIKLRDDRSLLISSTYLLKAIQMVGKEPNNFFTPIQKLSELSLADNYDCCRDDKTESADHVCARTIKTHPAYGFKVGLIRLIGNLVYQHEKNQNLVRENQGIPLLLDCCNLDARNPLIIQWTTLAIRNLLENNKENQEIIRKSVKIGQIDSATMRELGLTLNENSDGDAIGIIPLPKKS
ncbi:uncharacterized protein LOC106660461 [Trichogramma pretiosum]|uniref:uncharacterized protein LOC106660461 n=1 Tax=Trichogramma pretiosum TaxID=7493 RepID=UPI0006C9CB54|nr:uncharacterized protein LOC106660461 [Trichogramma pretiosum]